MIPNVHQSINEIIEAATPAEKILWQQIRLFTGERAAVQQFYHYGGIGELQVFDATKLYFATELEISIGGAAAVPYASMGYVKLKNAADLWIDTLGSYAAFWDATAAAAKYVSMKTAYKNMIFGRLEVGAYYSIMKVIGYKITY